MFINNEAKEDNRFILHGSDSESKDQKVRKKFVKNCIISSEADTEETEKSSEEVGGVPENVNEEIFDAKDRNIDTSGLTDHIHDCVDKLGEDMQLADLSSLNVSYEIKRYGK